MKCSVRHAALKVFALLASVQANLIVLTLLTGAVPGMLHASGPAPLPTPDLQLLTNGTVHAMALLPDGGIVLGGSFSSVNGVPRSNLARQGPDGELDLDWNPGADNQVRALSVDLSSGEVFVGGYFSHIGGLPRPYLAKISADGEVISQWNPQIDGAATSIAFDGRTGSVFVAGGFYRVGSTLTGGLAKISAASDGMLDPIWRVAAGGIVYALTLDDIGETLFVAGQFSAIGNQTQINLAKVSVDGVGVVDPDWRPNPIASVKTLRFDPTANQLYVGGSFLSIGGKARSRIARVAADGTGAADATWNPSANDEVLAIEVDASRNVVYAAGYFTRIGGSSAGLLARLSMSGAGALDTGWTAFAQAYVYALQLVPANGALFAGGTFKNMGLQPHLGLALINVDGSTATQVMDVESPGFAAAFARLPDGAMIVGGSFAKAGQVRRRNLLRMASDGTLDPVWNVSPDSQVTSLAVDSSGLSVYVGGYFASAEGINRHRLLKVASQGTAVIDADWNPDANSAVLAMEYDPSSQTMYVGGAFTQINGLPAQRIARVSTLGAGALDTGWNPSADNLVFTLAHDETENVIFLGGWFTHVNGTPRARLAKLGTADTGVLDPLWDPSADNSVATLARSGEYVYVGGYFSQLSGVEHAYLARVDAAGSGALDPVWNPAPSAEVKSVAIGNGVLYAGGWFTQMGISNRRYVASLSLSATGAVDPYWDPSPNADVRALSLASFDADRIDMGGSFSSIGAVSRSGAATIPVFDSDRLFANGFEQAVFAGNSISSATE